MPAAGARVQVVDSAGAVVMDGLLADDGTLAADRMDVTVRDGEVEATLNLPRLTASK